MPTKSAAVQGQGYDSYSPSIKVEHFMVNMEYMGPWEENIQPLTAQKLKDFLALRVNSHGHESVNHRE